MDLKGLTKKISSAVIKYKYAAIVLLVGVCLLLMPNRSQATPIIENSQHQDIKKLEATELADVLQSIQGAGKVNVLLSVASGEKTIYQSDSDIVVNGDSSTTKQETVIVTDSQRTETGLISQINPPVYLGAIVVCEGADNPTVKLAVTQAVAKITGLGTDSICVLKMES